MSSFKKFCLVASLFLFGLGLGCRCDSKAVASSRPTVLIQAHYPGASPLEVEQGLALSLESTLLSIPGVVRVSSRASEGLLTTWVEGEGPSDGVDLLKADVVKRVSAVLDTWPADAERPLVQSLHSQRILLLALTGSLDPSALQELARSLRLELLQVPGVSGVALLGERPRQVVVEVDPARLAALGIGLGAVRTALLVDEGLPAGALAGKGGQVLIRTTGSQVNPDALSEVILPGGVGQPPVRLGDVAQIRSDLAQSSLRLRGRSGGGLALSVALRSGTPGLKAIDSLENKLRSFAQTVPPGLAVELLSLSVLDSQTVILGRLHHSGESTTWDDQPHFKAVQKLLHDLPSQPRYFMFSGDCSTLALPGNLPATSGVVLLVADEASKARRWVGILSQGSSSIPELKMNFSILGDVLSPLSRLEVVLSLPELTVLHQGAERVVRWLEQRPEVAAVWAPDLKQKPEINLESDRAKLAAFGLSQFELARQVRMHTQGELVGERLSSGRAVQVILRTGKDAPAEDHGDLARLLLQTPQGTQVPLAQVARIVLEQQPSSVLRIDGRRSVRLEVDLALPVADELIQSWRTQIADLISKESGLTLAVSLNRVRAH